MAFRPALTPKQKALEINLNDRIYGSFAEIGAGQEVARTFFRAGGAAGTIAKSLSAYDMTMSDAVYGKSEDPRYVSKSRLKRMLDIEFESLLDRLQVLRPEGTRFFAFCNTVSAKAYRGNKPCHGWLGVRFQHEANELSSEVIIHIRMLDNQNVLQQEAVGAIGTNLIHACYNYTSDSKTFVKSLMENLTNESIEIDMIRAKGPAFKNIDSRILNLELVKNGLTEVVLFDEDGQVLMPTDELYKKNILVLRGSFRPPTHVNFDMLENGIKKFTKFLGEEESKTLIVVPEISMHNLRSGGEVSNEDFLARVDLLSALGQKVLVSNHNNLYCLNKYLSKQTKKNIAFVLGINSIQDLLEPKQYEQDTVSMLEALGQMFGHKSRIYAYPAKKEDSDEMMTIDNLDLPQNLETLKSYLLDSNFILPMTEYNKDSLHIFSRTVLKMIQDNEDGWEKYVPRSVSLTVKEKNLFQSKAIQ